MMAMLSCVVCVQENISLSYNNFEDLFAIAAYERTTTRFGPATLWLARQELGSWSHTT